jgi:hypothetical protein
MQRSSHDMSHLLVVRNGDRLPPKRRAFYPKNEQRSKKMPLCVIMIMNDTWEEEVVGYLNILSDISLKD